MHSHRCKRQRSKRRGRALRRATTCAVRLRAFALLARRRHHLAIAEHLRLSHRRRLFGPGAGRHHVQRWQAALLRLLRHLGGPIGQWDQLAANLLPLQEEAHNAVFSATDAQTILHHTKARTDPLANFQASRCSRCGWSVLRRCISSRMWMLYLLGSRVTFIRCTSGFPPTPPGTPWGGYIAQPGLWCAIPGPAPGDTPIMGGIMPP